MCVPGWMAVTFQVNVRVLPGARRPSAQVFVYAVVPPTGPSSTIQTGRLGSARPGCWLRVLNESTVTARSGIARVSVFLTEIVRASCLARLWDDANDAFTTFIENVPEGSFLSWRSPPPQPATTNATTDVASAAVAPLYPVTARGTYQSPERLRAGCGAVRLPFGSARDPPVVLSR